VSVCRISPASNGNFFSKGEDYFALAASKAGEKEKAADLFKKVADWNQNGLHFALVRTKAKMPSKIRRLKWTDIPDVKGAKQAVLWGDPSKGAHGMFVTFPAGTEVPLHTHSHDGRGAVISGTLVITLEGKTPKELVSGSYFFVPGEQKHTTGCKSGANCLFLDQSSGAFDLKMAEATAAPK